MTGSDPSRATPAKARPTAEKDKLDPIGVVCASIRGNLESGKRVRRAVFTEGRLFLDRLLPFLVLYRKPCGSPDLGTGELATTCAAYLVATDDKRDQKDVLRIVDAVRAVAMHHFGAFLLIELWSRPPEHAPISATSVTASGEAATEAATSLAGFRLFGSPRGDACDAMVDVLAEHLGRVKSVGRLARIEVPDDARDFPRRVRPLYAKPEDHLLQIGIEIEPSYRNADATGLFPGVLRTLRSGIDRALRHALFHFARRQTTHRPQNFHSLGRRALVKAVWDADQKLDSISSSFDFLRAVTPIDLRGLWTSFRSSNYERMPTMRYRALPIDPSQTKRELFSIPIERIEDPTMVELFREKQEELDRQLTMLKDRGSERFLLGGVQLYGRISGPLVRTAEELLERVPATRSAGPSGRLLEPAEFIALAEQEIAHYRALWDGVDATVTISSNVMAGIMVSKGHLLLDADVKTRERRADALLQHEIGTHLVTYYNGKAQPLTQLKSGLAGYEELQEGLAVLAEYLVSGMTPARLRILAARVLAAKAVTDGATFVDTFRLLCRYGFSSRGSFQIALRIYRGGGFIKDCVYLRGLTGVLEYLATGEPLERLFVGKIAMDHVHIMAELETRGVIVPPKLLPRYLERPECQRRLAAIRHGKKVSELLSDDSKDVGGD